jgi:hypothetical protein
MTLGTSGGLDNYFDNLLDDADLRRFPVGGQMPLRNAGKKPKRGDGLRDKIFFPQSKVADFGTNTERKYWKNNTKLVHECGKKRYNISKGSLAFEDKFMEVCEKNDIEEYEFLKHKSLNQNFGVHKMAKSIQQTLDGQLLHAKPIAAPVESKMWGKGCYDDCQKNLGARALGLPGLGRNDTIPEDSEQGARTNITD